jgi:hypothetical protein
MFIPILVPSVSSDNVEEELREIRRTVTEIGRKQPITLNCILSSTVNFYDNPSHEPVSSCPHYNNRKCNRTPCKEDIVKMGPTYSCCERMAYLNDRRCLLLNKLTMI